MYVITGSKNWFKVTENMPKIGSKTGFIFGSKINIFDRFSKSLGFSGFYLMKENKKCRKYYFVILGKIVTSKIREMGYFGG